MSQHMDALDLANKIRLKRAELKREVAAGDTDITDLILNPPDEILNMTFYEMFRAQHRWGRERTMRFFRSVNISETLTFGALSEERRNQFVKAVRRRR